MAVESNFYPHVLTGRRQTGKTTQLLQHIRDHLTDNALPFDEVKRDIVVFCRNRSLMEVHQERLGELSNRAEWLYYEGDGIPSQLAWKEAETVCFFLDVTFDDDVVRELLLSNTHVSYPNPSFIELSFDIPNVKFLT